MPRVLRSATLPHGHQLLVVAANSSCGGRWRHPVRLRLVETDGTPYTTVRQQNVLRVISYFDVDGRYTGPRSRYHAALTDLTNQMQIEAKNYRPGAPVPPCAPEVTAEMLADLLSETA